jgi:ABC-type multidrug transport system fused ATPase/permease subunit
VNDRQGQTGGQALPRFAVPGRRARLAALVGMGVTVALLSAGTARLVSLLSHSHDKAGGLLLSGGLLALVAAASGLRVLERRVAERLGQDYVHQIRKELIGGALGPGRSPSLGITIARTSNDLNSVRNWVTHGIAAAASGIPLILVLTAALWIMAPPLALAVMGPLLGAVALLALLSRPTYEKARALRKARGRLAGQITDTINAATAVRAASGEERELGRVDRLGREVIDAAIERATFAGSLRATTIGTASATAVAVAATGAFTGLDQGLVAGALTIVSMISGPVHDLGRIVEYRQSYRAARHSIAPALRHPLTGTSAGEPAAADSTGLVIAGLSINGTPMPELTATPGETILLDAADHTDVDELFHVLLGLHPPALHSSLCVVLDGKSLLAMSPPQRRHCLGYAARGLALERGQLRRAIRYRTPDADDTLYSAAINRAGLGETITRLPKGDLTVLRRGGEPLSTPERAQVQLARATLANPPLLLLNHIDADLDAHGVTALRDILTNYPGIVIAATNNPTLLPRPHRIWPEPHPDPLLVE